MTEEDEPEAELEDWTCGGWYLYRTSSFRLLEDETEVLKK